MTKIKPTIGRVVWYYPEGRRQVLAKEQPYAATIAYVHSDDLINVGYLDNNGNARGATSVRLIQEGDEQPMSGFCCWMPFQTAQAAKAAQAEEVADAARAGAAELGNPSSGGGG